MASSYDFFTDKNGKGSPVPCNEHQWAIFKFIMGGLAYALGTAAGGHLGGAAAKAASDAFVSDQQEKLKDWDK